MNKLFNCCKAQDGMEPAKKDKKADCAPKQEGAVAAVEEGKQDEAPAEAAPAEAAPAEAAPAEAAPAEAAPAEEAKAEE